MINHEITIPDEIARISCLANRCLTHVQQDLAEEALLAARKATEGMLYNVSRQKNFIKDTKPRSLKDYLDIFRGKHELVPQVIYRHIETIQHHGNDAGHFQAIEITYDTRTLQNCLNALVSILLWYIDQTPASSAQCLLDVSQSIINTVPLIQKRDNTPDNIEPWEDMSLVDNSQEEIVRLLEKADQKDIHAMMYLAKLYKEGYAGISRDLDKAFGFFAECVESADDDALVSIALDEMSKVLYSQHRYPESFQYALRSAEMGNPRIMLHLAFLYNRGIGTQLDKAAAEKWYLTAAEMKNPIASLARHDLARFYKHSVSNPEIREQLRQSAALNHTASCYELGEAYFWGIYGFPQDHIQAKEWLELAADDGDAKAMFELGRMYYWGGSAFPADYVRSAKWYEKAIQLNHPEAANHLAYLYEFGFLGTPDYQTAKAQYKAAADQGDLFSMHKYGYLCLMDTHSIKPEYRKAREYLEKAAQQNYAMSYCALAEMEYLGLGQNARKAKARTLFREARDRGDVWPDIILEALN